MLRLRAAVSGNIHHPVRPLLATLTWIFRWQLGGTVGIILVYDVTKAASFRACQKWFATWRQENPDVIMLGNISAPVIQSGCCLTYSCRSIRRPSCQQVRPARIRRGQCEGRREMRKSNGAVILFLLCGRLQRHCNVFIRKNLTNVLTGSRQGRRCPLQLRCSGV